eukprot:PhF_6_TR43538/c0_g1_i1/m.66840
MIVSIGLCPILCLSIILVWEWGLRTFSSTLFTLPKIAPYVLVECLIRTMYHTAVYFPFVFKYIPIEVWFLLEVPVCVYLCSFCVCLIHLKYGRIKHALYIATIGMLAFSGNKFAFRCSVLMIIMPALHPHLSVALHGMSGTPWHCMAMAFIRGYDVLDVTIRKYHLVTWSQWGPEELVLHPVRIPFQRQSFQSSNGYIHEPRLVMAFILCDALASGVLTR